MTAKIQMTKIEKTKWEEYLALMGRHDVEPRSEAEWLRVYRETQGRADHRETRKQSKKGAKRAKPATE